MITKQIKDIHKPRVRWYNFIKLFSQKKNYTQKKFKVQLK